MFDDINGISGTVGIIYYTEAQWPIEIVRRQRTIIRCECRQCGWTENKEVDTKDEFLDLEDETATLKASHFDLNGCNMSDFLGFTCGSSEVLDENQIIDFLSQRV